MPVENQNTTPVSTGIKQLVDTLRQEGVEAGKKAADQIIAEAREEASTIVAEARDKAGLILGNARKEADFISTAGKQAFEMANRNAILELKAFLQDEFSKQIQATVGTQLTDEKLLQQMILEVAGRNAVNSDEPVEVILPTRVVGVNDLSANPEELKEGTLIHFAVAQAAEMLREGVTFNVSEDNKNAVVFRLKDKDIEVALSDETVTQMMLNHLQPRFRALLEGIVK
ncbi:hypothetical protein ACQKPX_04575 [Photobacterium sp. DNB23_23_1]|uniref:V-type ATP synthase subunit E n=1 Tax=Photobacterium pectinilyticum TaxID=2906793 RepID=A0ABT1MZ41_9GAMM|nr:hypothetical protein [Photobacterium sp. ZSDE20]MCQ1057740.1 hypothetical protein [Photobacterium sp. ZSDE20]MDD1822049.1 hypothetical protein [Photobacterium sp. ZSDE20]